MLPFTVARVVVRELFEYFHVRRQSDAYVGSFDEIVTEQSLLRESAVEYFVKGANIVNGLAMVDGFAEQVLIDVGNGLTIRVRPACVRKQPGETRGRRRWQRDTHTGLNDGVAARSIPSVSGEFHTVQRVRD